MIPCELHGSREKGNKSWMWTHTSEIMEIATLSRQVESNCSYGGYEYGIDPKGWGYGSFPRLNKETNGNNKMIARGPHQNSLCKATLLLHLMLGSSSYLAFHVQLSHTISHGRGPFSCMDIHLFHAWPPPKVSFILLYSLFKISSLEIFHRRIKF